MATSDFKLVIKIVNAGTKIIFPENETSFSGHMWFELHDKNNKLIGSYGFGPKEGLTDIYNGEAKIITDDYKRYEFDVEGGGDYKRVFDINEEQFNTLQDFGKNPKKYDFDSSTYNLNLNSCVDFTWKALELAGFDVSYRKIAIGEIKHEDVPQLNIKAISNTNQISTNYGLYEFEGKMKYVGRSDNNLINVSYDEQASPLLSTIALEAKPKSYIIDGGAGVDTVSYANFDVKEGGVHVSLNNSNAQKIIDYGKTKIISYDQIKNVENIIGSKGDDKIFGNAKGNYLEGGAGNDKISGGIGDDEIFGGSGNDIIKGDEGSDTLNGGSGNDEIYGGAGNDKLEGGSGLDTYFVGANSRGTTEIVDIDGTGLIKIIENNQKSFALEGTFDNATKKLLNATNGKQYDAELKNKNLEIKISEVKKLVIKNFDTTNNAFSIKVVNAPNSQPKITKNLGDTALKAKPESDFKLANDLSGFKLNFSKLPFGFNQDFNFQDLSAKYDLSPLFNKLAPQLKVSADQLPSLLWLNIEKFGTPTFSLKFDTQKILDLGGVNLASLDLGAQSSIGGVLTSIADFSDDFLYGKLDLSKDVGSQIAFNYVFHNGETAKIGYSQFSGDASKQLESIGVKFDKDAIISVQKNDGSPLSFISDTVNYFSDQLNSFFRVNDLLRITSETSAGMVKYINDIVSPAAKLMADILGNDANFNNSFTQLAQMLMQGKSVDEAVSYLAQNTLLDASVKYALKQSGLDSLVASVQIPGVNFVNVIADLVSKGADSAEDLVKKSMVAGVNYIVSNACYSAGATLGNSILPGIGGVIGGAIGSAVASVLMIPIANLIGDAVNAVGELLAKTSQHLVELNIGAIINDAIKFVGQIFEAIGKCIGAIVKAIGDFLGLSDAPEPMQWLSFQAKNDGSNGDYIVVANPSGGYSVVARDGFKDDLVGSNQTNDSLIGSNEANNLFGRNGDDFLDGRSGDDILVGGSGADVLVGGEGSDVILGDEVRSIDNVGDSFNDFIDGGAGDDKISAGFGDDFVLAGTGNDIIQGEEGDDVILGGAGNDTISGDLGNDMILGGAGNDIIKGGEGDDVILGGEGDDFIAGDAGNDLLFGGAGNDYLLGGDGNDVLISSAGNDVLNGGAGNDEFYITKNVGSITTIADFNPLYDKINLSDFRIKNPEQITYEQVGDDLHLDLGDGQELVLKGISDELISIDNFIFNNSRKDQVAYMSALDKTYGALDEKINNINQSQSYNYNQAHFDAVYVPTYFLGIRIGQKIDRFDYHYEGNFADWNAQNSKFIGNYGNDSVYGNDGNDALYGNAGDDYIDGGSGDDYLQGSGGIDNLNGGAGNDAIFTGNGEDLLFGGDGDDYMDGGIGNDIIDGGSGNNAIFAGNGNDLVRVESGSSRIVAGSGDDIIMVSSLANDATQVWAGVGNDQITASAGNDQIFGEDGNDVIDAGNGYNLIMGGAGNDKITSGFDGAEIDGGAGDDSITSLGSNNHINGGAGNDKIFVGNRFSYLNSANNIFLNEINDDFGDNYVEVNYGKATITLGDGNDGVLTSLGDDEIDAGNGDNYVNAGSGNNTVFIGDGNDTIITGAGDDMIYGGAGDDSIDAGNGNNQIYLGNGNKIVKTGDNNDIVSTGSGNDQIRTGGGVDEIYAGAGNDYIFIDSTSGEIYGQGGSDTYFVNNLDGDIKIIEGEVNNLEFFDSELVVDPNLLDASISHTQINTIGFQAKQLSYLRLAQNGNDLTISFSNKSGKITIVNQFQNANQPQIASLKFGDAIINLTSFIAGTAGNDVINGTINSDIVIGDLGKDLIFGNDGNDFIDGGAGNDYINTGTGMNVVDGGAGDDVIIGGTGDDILVGGKGSDIITGGLGSDIFKFNFIEESYSNLSKSEVDLIIDFAIGEDKIDLSTIDTINDFNALTITYDATSNTTKIDYASSDFAVKFSGNIALSESDFIF